ETEHETLGKFYFAFDKAPDGTVPKALFTDNHTNAQRVFGTENDTPYVRDAFHQLLIEGRQEAVNPNGIGTKVAPHYGHEFAPGESQSFNLRIWGENETPDEPFGEGFERTFVQRKLEADYFYSKRIPVELSKDQKDVCRQGYAGLLWTKQFYHYVLKDWIDGDAYQPPPPVERVFGRNHEWKHFFARDVISMPDKWEYPWFAAWDLAFHMIPFARIDSQFAKQQLILFLREWYMHPNGQLPAYEFNFSDVNPPVHAWAAWRVYKISACRGQRDTQFLESVFQKLLLNFTWWVNRKDLEGNNLFSGGFLGLDNIGVFDRSKPLPTGGHLQQADGTAWMAFYCLTMLSMALELAENDPVYEDMASKFFEHFVMIADAINELGGRGLWDDDDGFYYDQLKLDHQAVRLKSRSLVGLLPLIAVTVIDDEQIERLSGFNKRLKWFMTHRADLGGMISYCDISRSLCHRLLSIPSREKLSRMLAYMLDENEFLSPFGIRSLSKVHAERPYTLNAGGEVHKVEYVPGEGNSYLFGGNSNWRGPIWFPINYLLVESLEVYHHFFGDEFKVECPTGSGNF
ncbi:MAG: glucosidase, partial [Cyanobacteria bacterium]|nr:glucosidase [Cyanobacteriota bacterium]